MRKLLGITLAVVFVATSIVRAEIASESRRMDGLNPGLVGIVSDEYSDFVNVNTVNILKIDGYRAYTQLTNLVDGADETPLAGGAAGAAGTGQFLLGGVVPLMDMGNLGAIINSNKSKLEESITHFTITTANTAGTNGVNVNNANTVPRAAAAENGDLDYENVNTATAGTTLTTSEDGTAYDNQGDVKVNLYAGLGILDVADLGIMIGYSKDYDPNVTCPNPIGVGLEEYDYSYSYTNSADADDFLTEDYSAKSEEYTSVVSIAPSVKKTIADVELGATVKLDIIKSADNDEIDATYTEGKTNGTIGGLTSTYERTYSYDDTDEMTGTGIGLTVDGAYPLNDTTKVKGVASVYSSKLDGTQDMEEVDNINKDGGLTLTSQKVITTMKADNERKESDLDLLVGIEKEVSSDLLLGVGIGINRNKVTTSNDPKRTVTNTDGTKTYSGTTIKTDTENIVTSYTLPIGLEWTATSWLKARLGSSYTITNSEGTTTTEVSTYANTTDANAEVTNVMETKGSNIATPRTNTVRFYSGVGFIVTDNLTVDVTNISGGGTSVLNIGAWELAATLMF